MRILLLHNRYQVRGGEDRVFEDDARVLLERGHEVIAVATRWETPSSIRSMIGKAGEASWSRPWYNKMNDLLERYRPEIVHAHNLFPVLSPSTLEAASDAGVPAVVTLHNYRLLCGAANLFRDGRPCEDCLGRSPWRVVLHGCYHGSRLHSAAVAWSMSRQRVRGCWEAPVSRFIAPSELTRNKMQAGGIPASKIVVKPHCVHPDPGPGRGSRDYVLWVGRRSPEKGLEVALNAWRDEELPPLRIAEGGTAGRAWSREPIAGVRWLPPLTREELQAQMKGARFLISTSLCYETFGLVVAEAFACATPAVVPAGSAMGELVSKGGAGLEFRSGDSAALAEKVRWGWHHPKEMRSLGEAARAYYERNLTGQASAAHLEAIYRAVLRDG